MVKEFLRHWSIASPVAHGERQVGAMPYALVDGRVNLAPGGALDDFVAQWTTLPGVGRWTAHYLAMRALSHPDACPVEDLILRRALPNDGTTVSPATLRRHAEAWRPWRAYAVMHLWRDAAHARPSARTTRSSR